jgi:hypothetical protein
LRLGGELSPVPPSEENNLLFDKKMMHLIQEKNQKEIDIGFF